MSPTNPEPKARRRPTAWTGLAISLVLGAALVGCSDGGDDEPAGPTTTVDIKAAELEVQCELVKSYVGYESSTRGALGSGLDAATAENFEQRRVAALDRVLGTFKGTVPVQVTAAADQLRTLPITAEPTAETAQQVTTSLKQLTDFFDPLCDTQGGRDPDDGTTTLPPLPASTVAGGGPATTVPGGTATTVPVQTTVTTAATTSSTS